MPAEVLAPVAALTAMGAKIIPGLAFIKTAGAGTAAAKGSGILALKSKSILTATHQAGNADAQGAHDALEKAKEDLGKVLNDVNEAETKGNAAAAAKSILAPFGFLSSFARVEEDLRGSGSDSGTLDGRAESLNSRHEKVQRGVRLSTVPERCLSYGSFL